MHRKQVHYQHNPRELSVHSYWSEEDGVFLAEVDGMPGTHTHAENERGARRAALELAQEWKRIETESNKMTLAEFMQWMHLSAEHATKFEFASASGGSRRSLQEWNRIWNTLRAS